MDLCLHTLQPKKLLKESISNFTQCTQWYLQLHHTDSKVLGLTDGIKMGYPKIRTEANENLKWHRRLGSWPGHANCKNKHLSNYQDNPEHVAEQIEPIRKAPILGSQRPTRVNRPIQVIRSLSHLRTSNELDCIALTKYLVALPSSGNHRK